MIYFHQSHISLRSKICSHLNYIFSSSDVSLIPFMFERHKEPPKLHEGQLIYFSTSNIKLIIFTGINWSRINDLFTKSPPPFFFPHTNQMVVPFISFSKLYFSQIHKLSQQKWIFTWVWYKYKRIDFIIFSRVYEWMKE